MTTLSNVNKAITGSLLSLLLGFSGATAFADEALAKEHTPNNLMPTNLSCSLEANLGAVKAPGEGGYLWGSASGCDSGKLSVEIKSQKSWIVIGEQDFSGEGSFSIALTGKDYFSPGTHEIRARLGSTYSPILSVRRYAEGQAAHSGAAFVGGQTYVWGTVPGLANARVWTEAYTGKSWERSQLSRTAANGFFSIPLTYGSNRAGDFAYRVAVEYPSGYVHRLTSYASSAAPSKSDYFWFTRYGVPTIATAGEKPIREDSYAWGVVRGGRSLEVWTEVRLPNGQWAKSQSGKTDDKGFYTLPLTYGKNSAGTYYFRVAARLPNQKIAWSAAVPFVRSSVNLDLDQRCLTGRVACASKTARKLAWVVNGKVQGWADARFGKKGYDTREGVFKVFWKSRYHTSTIYGSYMPYAMFFSGGQAIHYSENFRLVGYNDGSAGCINIRDEGFIDWLFKQVRVGDKVVVHW